MISTIFYLNEQGKRANLEDTIFPLPGNASINDKLFIVCDGVGGSSKGEEASRITCEAISDYILTKDSSIINLKVIEAGVHFATYEMQDYVLHNPEAENMSTTMTLAYFSPKGIHIAWCGDSRVYHIRDGRVLWQSKDHSLVQQLVDTGEITPEEANCHPNRNVILRSLNASKTNSIIDLNTITNFKKGDYILLCTDGVLENIGAKELKEIFEKHQLEKDKKKLMLNYCEGKTSDNYSMYLLEVNKSSKPKPKKIVVYALIFLFIFLAGVYCFYTRKINSNKNNAKKELRHTVSDLKIIKLLQNKSSQKNKK